MNPFDRAWDLLKDIDYDVLADVATGRDNFDRERYPDAKQMLMEVMEDPTNLPQDPIARTPKLFRSMGEDEVSSMRIGDRSPMRYFSPQRVVAQQYSERWRDPESTRSVGEFEMPVPLDHDSVFRFYGPDTYRAFPERQGITDEQRERLAEGSGISNEEMEDRLLYARDAYHSSPAFSRGSKEQRRFNEMMRNAGYDYVRHNEVASSEANPPVFNRITRKVPSDGLGIDPKVAQLNRDIQERFGYKYPYKTVWHIGDEESAPVLTDISGEPTKYKGTSRADRLLDLLFSGRIDDIYGGIYGYSGEDVE